MVLHIEKTLPLSLFLLLLAVKIDGKDEAPELCSHSCWDNIFPACGVDGKTYDNYCRAACATNITSVYDGPCKPDSRKTLKECSKCPTAYDPVCGVDGTTYTTECFRNCSGVKLAFKGPCFNATRQCIAACKKPDSPVCGRGITYPSKCLAQCTGISQVKPGPCAVDANSSCFCNVMMDNQPAVCTVERSTFSNRCYAKCAGVKVIYEGDCLNTPRSSAAENNWMRWATYRVCGTNGKAYRNLCHAKCAGVGVASMIGGPRPCPKETAAELAVEDAERWN